MPPLTRPSHLEVHCCSFQVENITASYKRMQFDKRPIKRLAPLQHGKLSVLIASALLSRIKTKVLTGKIYIASKSTQNVAYSRCVSLYNNLFFRPFDIHRRDKWVRKLNEERRKGMWQGVLLGDGFENHQETSSFSWVGDNFVAPEN